MILRMHGSWHMQHTETPETPFVCRLRPGVGRAFLVQLFLFVYSVDRLTLKRFSSYLMTFPQPAKAASNT
jgi:hypothetical protein